MSVDPRREWDVVVLGGGASGLSLAHRLGELGIPALVLEARSRPGGLAGSFQLDGFTLDYGPHNIHCSCEADVEVFRKLLGANLLDHSPRAKILFRGKLVDYPLKGLKALAVLDPWTGLKCAGGFLWARTARKFRPGPDLNYRDWIVSRFGRGLYNAYFGPYSQKVWGVDPACLSTVIAEKRIPTPSVGKLLLEALFRRKPPFHPEHPEHVLSFYPKEGIGQLMDSLVVSIRSSGGDVRLGARVTALLGSGTPGYLVEYRQGRSQERATARMVCSTLPLPVLLRMLEPPVPTDVRSAGEGLRYRSLMLLYLLLDIPRALESPWVYFSDVRVPFNRVYEVGRFSPAIVPVGRTALCFEVSCWRHEAQWRQTGWQLAREADRLLSLHWPSAAAARSAGAFTKRFETVYPVFDLGYEARLSRILDHLGELGNLVTFGRQGLFTYVNVDHCFDMGYELAESIAEGRNPDARTLFASYRPPGAFERLMDGA